MRDLLPALEHIHYQAGFSRLDGLSLLTSLQLPTPSYIVLSGDDQEKIHERDAKTIDTLVHRYRLKWKGDYITVTSNDPDEENAGLSTETTRGDANLFAAIQSVANNVASNLKHASKQSIIVMRSPQPTFAGSVITFHPVTGNKNQYCISTTNGCWSDDMYTASTQILFDIRTKQVVEKKKPQAGRAGVRRVEGVEEIRSQPDEQTPPKHILEKVVVAAQVASQKIFAPLQITWEYVNGEVLFTGIRKIDRQHQLPTNTAMDTVAHLSQTARAAKTTLLASGQVICGGTIRGQAGRDILITQQLTGLDIPKLKEVSGVVCYSHIRDGSVISFLKKHHIPSIAGVQPNLGKQPSDQELLLDANTGSQGTLKTVTAQEPHQAKDYSSIVKVYRWQKNPFFNPKHTGNYSLATARSYPDTDLFAPDGAVFSNDFLLQLQHTHPVHEIKKNPQAFSLTLVDALIQTDRINGLAAYQTSDLHSRQLENMSFATNYDSPYSEGTENPAFGVRGGLGILQDSTYFKAELTALAEASKKLRKDVPCIVPFVRSVPELVWISNILEEINQSHQTNIPLYLSIDLPSQIHQLQYFLRPAVKGLVVNAHRLHAVSYGLDFENQVLISHYPLDKSLVRQYLAQVTTHVTSNIPVWVLLDSNAKELIQDAYHWGVRAIVTKATQVQNYKTTLKELEQKL